jgi:hypothetical protein
VNEVVMMGAAIAMMTRNGNSLYIETHFYRMEGIDVFVVYELKQLINLTSTGN